MMMHTFVGRYAVGLSLAASALAPPAQQPWLAVFDKVGLTPQQIAAIDEGRPVAKTLSWGGPSEVYVFGAVYVNGSPTAYLRRMRDISGFTAVPGYLATGELSASATPADLDAIVLDADDVKALKSCREGACDVQLPAASIQTFRDGVNWSQPDASNQANALARGMVIDLAREYRRRGNGALGVYRDKQKPADVKERLEAIVDRVMTLADAMPELRRYLLEYPDAPLADADSFLSWEKVDFGMKPTIRVNHGVISPARADDRDVSAVAIKQLYASHYFHSALDLSVCMKDTARPDRRGFYLLTLKASEQDGLTGPKGSLLRKVVVDKTRSSLESALASIKESIEQPASSAKR